MNQQYLSVLISFFISLTMQAYIPIHDIKGNISSLNITIKEENYFESVINDTIQVMKNYAFINILKSPPKVNGRDYFKKVDIIQQLENLKTTITKETKFYQFYQEISKIIYSAKDYHIIFTYIKQEKPFDLLTKLSICSPIEFIFKKDKGVLGKINNLVLALGGGKVQIENQESINNNYINKIAIKQINGINVYEFIRNFCGDYIQFKSPSAKFVWNRENIKIAQLWQCPLNSEEFHYFNITYSNGVTISSKYIGFLNNNEINELKNFGINNYEVNPTYNNELFNSISEQNAINWDINIDNHIKCKVDNINHVNVIYQNSFKTNSPDHIGIVNNFSYCHGNFSNNDYPLIVIENLNGGGFAQLSKLMQQLVQDLMRPKNYFSIIINEKTREFLRANKDSFIFVDDEEKICDVIVEYCNKEKYNTDVAYNGQEALEKINKKNYDLLVLDIMMPKMSGFELLKKLKNNKKIPTIILSAKDQEYDKLEGFELGIDDYITKPFSPRELIARIKAILSRTNKE